MMFNVEVEDLSNETEMKLKNVKQNQEQKYLFIHKAFINYDVPD